MKMLSQFLKGFCFFYALLSSSVVFSDSETTDFTVSDIRVEGLQRVSAGTVFSEFPVNVGENVDSLKLANAARRLFQTGLFTDIHLSRDDDDLIVEVRERPSVSKIDIEGNKDIAKGDLMNGLKKAGLIEGKVFKRETLERLELEIQRSYVAQGRYNASVKAEVEDLPRNRVAINLKIKEGDVATIQHVNFIGNTAFSNDDLANLMELKTTNFWSFITSDDKYSKQKLSGDLERVRSQYLDNGYIKFSVESTQVSISPQKDEVFITVNVAEGPQFKVRDTELKGELIVKKEILEKLTSIVKPGEIFSRQKLTLISDLISKRLGKEGYTFASVNAIPEPHDDNTATVRFFVDPGRRNYVRRVNFKGNLNTADEVLRQQMVQLEGASASTDLIEASKTRLERLGFFKSVNVETPSVPGKNDQIDVNYTVEEQSSGSLNASLGYSQGSGLSVGFSVSERNFMGSGKTVSFGVNTSSSVKSANFSYLNPYYTVDGVSRGFSIFARRTNFDKQNSSDYVLDRVGGTVTFGYPIDSVTRLRFSLGVTNSKLTVGDFPPVQIDNFVKDEGDNFNLYTLTSSWTRNTLDRASFARSGWSRSVSFDTTVPSASDLEFFRFNLRSNYYLPIDDKGRWVFHHRSEFGYGESFGNTKTFPFFEHYFAGGIGSVRGYESNTLGLRATPNALDSFTPDPFGGNVLIENSFELIFPIPLVDDQRSMRFAWFVDTGNVFDSDRGFDPKLSEIRYSAGLSFNWVTVVGPLGFSFAKTLNDQPGDNLQFFQFTLGQPF